MRHMGLWVAASICVVSIEASAQGQSPIDVVSIMASPSTFQAGTQVTFSVQLKNTGSQKTKSGTIYLDVFRGDQLKPSDFLWGTTQDVGRLEPGATEPVEFAGKEELRGSVRVRAWTVPSDGSEVFSVRVGVVDAPHTIARIKVARFVRKCSYSKPAPLTSAPDLPATDLRSLKRTSP